MAEILVIPEELYRLTNNIKQFSSNLMDIAHQLNSSLLSLHLEIAEKAQIEDYWSQGYNMVQQFSQQMSILAVALNSRVDAFVQADQSWESLQNKSSQANEKFLGFMVTGMGAGWAVNELKNGVNNISHIPSEFLQFTTNPRLVKSMLENQSSSNEKKDSISIEYDKTISQNPIKIPFGYVVNEVGERVRFGNSDTSISDSNGTISVGQGNERLNDNGGITWDNDLGNGKSISVTFGGEANEYGQPVITTDFKSNSTWQSTSVEVNQNDLDALAQVEQAGQTVIGQVGQTEQAAWNFLGGNELVQTVKQTAEGLTNLKEIIPTVEDIGGEFA